MSKVVQIVDQRPLGSQEAWDQHCEAEQRKSVGWRVLKLTLIVGVTLFVLGIFMIPMFTS